uniref:Lipoxygenase domain-containing protein n=1 Tax=Kryptolebias marmoratus TaxID=37003 RepID=A0A3Q2ZGV4_KRYMA
MVDYEVTVFTGNNVNATTFNIVFIKLVGTDGESEREHLVSLRGASVASFSVTCPTSIGELVLVEIDKKPLLLFPEDSWFLSKVEVKSPEGRTFTFPIYRWISDSMVHRFRAGKETEHKLCFSLSWNVYVEGIPHCMKADSPQSLPCEVRFSFIKQTEFLFTSTTGSGPHILPHLSLFFYVKLFQTSFPPSLSRLKELQLKGLADRKERWTNIDDIDRVFCCKRTDISEYIQQHWREDAFFGYQFLNGLNPTMIRRCKALPSNFPVTDDMVQIHGQGSLSEEIEVICLKLKQEPANDNPIFFPTDSEYDWLLAKTFVRSADSNVHQLNFHLLRTHLLAEVFSVSLLRNMPMVHPLYKLIIPHTRYTLQINFLARLRLISKEGTSGGEGMITILRSSLSSLTYSSLCMPEDIAERGLEDVPNFCYRDDGLKLWDIIHRFVQGVLGYYYKTDVDVQQDSELQKWLLDIFEHGFLGQTGTGIPQRFTTVNELIKFVTMVVFTGSAQHAAVNSGQYDFGGWMPNTPLTLQLPPPTKKGEATEKTLLNTLPDVNATVQGLATLWLLSQQSSDFVPLGHYPEDHFTEETPCRIMKEFQRELEVLSGAIKKRNEHLEVPYTYLDPVEVENSVAI